MFEGSFLTTKGHRSYRANDQIFHSLYDPEKEVENFIFSLEIKNINPSFILIGETMGYLSHALKRKYPRSRIIAVFPEKDLLQNTPEVDHVCALDSLEAFRNFLASEITEDNLALWTFLVWPPFKRAFPKETQFFESTFLDFFRQIQGSLLTQMYFGRTWFLNTLKNLSFFPGYKNPNLKNTPIIIAASGPSLSDNKKDLLKYRNEYFLLALPSSLLALKTWGIKPDAVIVSDGGYWSRFHLQYLPVDSWLIQGTSSVFSPEIHSPRIFYSQDLFYEDEILKHSKSYLKIPSQGTVAVSALNWALKSTAGPIIQVGLDLCYKDDQGHVKPHSFDTMELATSGRLNPWETKKKAALLQAGLKLLVKDYFTSPSLLTYSSYFKAYVPSRKIYRLNASPQKLEVFQNISISELPTLFLNNQKEIPKLENPESYRSYLKEWISDIKTQIYMSTKDKLNDPVEKLIKSIFPQKVQKWNQEGRSEDTWTELKNELTNLLQRFVL